MSNAITVFLLFIADSAKAFTGRSGLVFGMVTSLSREREPATRWNCKGACKACGTKTSLFGALRTARCTDGGGIVPAGRLVEIVFTADGRAYLYENGEVFVPCRGCARLRRATRIAGKTNYSKTCNAKCEAACGPSCECACGGKNHGANVSL